MKAELKEQQVVNVSNDNNAPAKLISETLKTMSFEDEQRSRRNVARKNRQVKISSAYAVAYLEKAGIDVQKLALNVEDFSRHINAVDRIFSVFAENAVIKAANIMFADQL